jgi:4-carboxymuconolactone decarboxylase
VLGEVWSRPQLSKRDRSIVVISILVWLGDSGELAVHINGGLNHGLTREEITEVIHHLSLYSGIPRAAQATRTLQEVLSAR